MTSTVLTLLACPTQSALTQAIINDMMNILFKHNSAVTQTKALAENEAYDIVCPTSLPSDVEAALYQQASTYPIDLIIQPVEHRRKHILIADMDSTMITIECIDELADFAGIKAQIAAITERAMNGELDFREALLERVALLKGLEETFLERVYNERVVFTKGAKTLVRTMRHHGAKTMLVSGGFTYFTDRVSSELGFEFSRANQLDIVAGKLTGKVHEPIVDKDTKLSSLQELCNDFSIAPILTMAVGDGANDLPMLKASGLGVAYRAKPHVKAQVKAKLDIADLSSLLYAQGYRKDQWSQ